ncbi:hypothetical protein ACFWIA_14070 [Streptomyces sp. NPDC127068]|uniref:hypothetical protein n=1 Tax=Streptomyces sp. NPDC127068 TaxID=3347127 RepID=UPI00365F4C44
MRSRTRGALAAAPVALALLLTGCGGGGSGDKVASADGGKSKGPGAVESLSPEQRALKLTECLRKNGLDVEDPKPGGGVLIGGGSNKKTDRAKADKAMAACRKWAPQGMTKGGDPKAMNGMREYAKCMRENGVDEFPDPEKGAMRLDRSIAEDPDFEAADKKCKSKLGKGGGLTRQGKG